MKCKENLDLIYKNNCFSVYVKPETKTKLIERRWGVETYLDNILEVHRIVHFVKYRIDEPFDALIDHEEVLFKEIVTTSEERSLNFISRKY